MTANQFQVDRALHQLVHGTKLLYCYQCGACTGGCPVSRTNRRYNPRRVLEQLILEKGEELFSSDAIWLCCLCHACEERCPQGVGMPDIFTDLKNEAAKRGKIPARLLEIVTQILKTGRAVELTPAIERRRSELNLAALGSSNANEILQIVEATGLAASLRQTRQQEGK